jgi:hypothetical protein
MTLRVVKTVGEVEMWQTVEEFPLYHKDQSFLNLISEVVEKSVIYG